MSTTPIAMRYFMVVPVLLTFTSCSKAPAPAPATQSSVGMKIRQNPTKPMISMSDPAVDDYIVKDISDTLEAKTWRWSFERPELRFQLKEVMGQKLEVHFSVAEATFKTTGPVTINFFVNNKSIGTMKVTKPGDQVFTKPVPADLLRTDDFTDVAIEARPFWTSGTDGRHLTLILTQAGFVADSAK